MKTEKGMIPIPDRLTEYAQNIPGRNSITPEKAGKPFNVDPPKAKGGERYYKTIS